MTDQGNNNQNISRNPFAALFSSLADAKQFASGQKLQQQAEPPCKFLGYSFTIQSAQELLAPLIQMGKNITKECLCASLAYLTLKIKRNLFFGCILNHCTAQRPNHDTLSFLAETARCSFKLSLGFRKAHDAAYPDTITRVFERSSTIPNSGTCFLFCITVFLFMPNQP